MKKLIIAAVVLVFVWGMYSEHRKQQAIEERNRQDEALFGNFLEGAGSGFMQPNGTAPGSEVRREIQGYREDPFPNTQKQPQRVYHYDQNGRPTGHSDRY